MANETNATNDLSISSTTSIIGVSLNGLFGVFAVYLTISLVCFEVRDINTTTSSRARFLRALCIVCSLIAIVHYWGEFASYFIGNSPSSCYALSLVWLGTYTFGVLITYIFLWTRQHIINNSPSLTYIHKKRLSVASCTVLILLILGIVMAFLAGSRLIFFSSCSNQTDNALLKLYTIILSGILLAITVIGQTMLLLLFIAPLLKHKKQCKTTLRRTRSSIKNCSSNMILVRRCVSVAIVSVITDVIAAIVTMTVQHPSAKLVYDFNLLVNIVCCLVSFRNWEQMVLPCLPQVDSTAINSATEQEIQTEEYSSRV
ncbi:unnamed protein product [Clavelina lepadiformis]|uniref:Taste receptor type 2 n=1 Tax=Clavelina lepadiformis TaxID=159417 RepID=A0ABP0H2X5_CLALP